MTTWTNVGALDAAGRRIPTKKALREMVKADATGVSFDRTSMHDGSGSMTAADIPQGTSLSVVGPCPYTDRRWYATVSRKADGSLRVQ